MARRSRVIHYTTEHNMKYKAILTDASGTWYGYGNTDHAAVMDAATLYPGTNKTQCALSVWFSSELVYCSTLSKYFDDIS